MKKLFIFLSAWIISLCSFAAQQSSPETVDRAEPVSIYAFQTHSYGSPTWQAKENYAWVKMALSDLSAVTVIKALGDDTDSSAASAGAYVNYAGEDREEVFIYRVQSGSPVDLASVNIATGDITSIATYSSSSIILADMAYDYLTKTMYAIDDNQTTTALYTVNLETGALTKVMDLEYGITSIEIDLDGRMWALTPTPTVSLAKIDKVTGAKTTLGVVDAYAQASTHNTLVFDHDTGMLYWHYFSLPSFYYLYSVDMETGAGTYIGSPSATASGTYGIGATALSIPFSLASGPWGVTDLTLTPGDEGARQATLSWTNPTINTNGTMATITKIEIYRNQELAHTIESPGAATTWVDNVPDHGIYTYEIVPYSTLGEGMKNSITSYVGIDVPDAPDYALLTNDDDKAIITWDTPLFGLNGAWLDTESITYSLTRSPGDVEIATGLTGLSYTDETIEGLGVYSYVVTAHNVAGKGGSIRSNEVTFKEFLVLPYYTGFEAYQGNALWTLENANGDNSRWSINATAGRNGSAAMRMAITQSTQSIDDWFYSPKMKLEEDNSYLVKFWACPVNNMYIEKLAIHLSSGTNKGTIKHEVFRNENLLTGWNEYSIILENYEGEFFLAFEMLSEAHLKSGVTAGMIIDDISIRELTGTDAAITDIYGPLTAMVGKEFIYKVNVLNQGTQLLTDYAISLIDSNENILATYQDGENIPVGASMMLNIPFTPSAIGELSLMAKIELIGDVDLENNMSVTIQTQVVENDRILDERIGDGEEKSIHAPFMYFFRGNTSQTLYYNHEVGQAGGISQMTLYYDFSEAIADSHVRIWMANTDREDLEDWVPASKFTLVYDGLLSYSAGINTLVIDLDHIFNYEGGNLAIMYDRPMDPFYYSNMQYFMSTRSSYSTTRTRYYQNSSHDDVFDWTQEGYSNNIYPNITLRILMEGVSVEGTVTDGTNPVEGVDIAASGTSYFASTSDDGTYTLEYLAEGSYELTVSKHGYETQTKTVEVSPDEPVEANFTLVPIEKYTLKGKVFDSNNVGIEGALVMLAGYDEFSATTAQDGTFEINNIYGGYTYDINVYCVAYEMHSTSEEINSSVSDYDIILTALPVPVSAVIAEKQGEDVVISWSKPDMMELSYGYGGADGRILGQGNSARKLYGSVYHSNTQIHEVSWFVNDVDNPIVSMNIFIFELDEDGKPTTSILYNVYEVPNIDLQWNTYQLPYPIEAENGFMFAISYSGTTMLLGVSNPTEDYPFTNDTHFFGDLFTEEFKTFESLSLDKVPMLKVKGYAMNDIQYSSGKATMPSANYNLYRFLEDEQPEDWTLLAHTVETSFTDEAWSELDEGTYQYAIIADYNDIEAIPAYSNTVYKPAPATYTVTFGITDENDNTITDAIITFNDEALAAGDYIVGDLLPDTYSYKVEHTAYQTKEGTITITDQDVTEVVTLTAKVAIDKVGLSNLSLFPNPFTNEVTLSDRQAVRRIYIYNTNGQLIQEIAVDGNKIDGLDNMNPGVYIFVLEDFNGNKAMHKLIKQ